MLVKWVTCRVPDREAFGLGQRAWAELRGVPGFLGQCGGWSRNATDVAQIFGFWIDRPSYQDFMDRAHDRIAAAQAGTYTDIRVRVLAGREWAGPPAGPVDFEPKWTVLGDDPGFDLLRTATAGSRW